MAYSLQKTASLTCDPTAKNRVWDFFDEPTKSRLENRPRTQQPRRKNRPSPTKTASGRPYWPSRDPIGEEGGTNLYGFLENNGVNNWDYLGMEPPEIGGYKTEKESAEAAGTEGMRVARKEWEDGIERAKENEIAFGKLPIGPREYGGRICKKCIISEDGTKTDYFTYTISPGNWVSRSDSENAGTFNPLLSAKCPEGWNDLVAYWHIHPGTAERVLRSEDPYEFVYSLGDPFSKADKEFVDGKWSRSGNWIVAGGGKGLWLTRYIRNSSGAEELKHEKH
jgi:hypothetical protein